MLPMMTAAEKLKPHESSRDHSQYSLSLLSHQHGE